MVRGWGEWPSTAKPEEFPTQWEYPLIGEEKVHDPGRVFAEGQLNKPGGIKAGQFILINF